jgi:hypothetical protein
VILVFLPFKSIFASEFYLSTPTNEIGIDSVFQVDVVLNTQDVYINAFSADIVFDKRYVEIDSVQDNSGVVSFWIDKPKERIDGILSFSGIIPGGLNASEIKLFTLTLKAKESGNTLFDFQNGRVLLHDGFGTDTSVVSRNLLLNISDVMNQLPLSLDTEPPDFFDPVLMKDPAYFDGKHALYFTTRDDMSGVKAYYVKEYKYWWQRYYTPWRLVESPYVLHDQELISIVQIKAVDGAENERIVNVLPKSNGLALIFIISVAVGMLYLFFVILRRRHRR